MGELTEEQAEYLDRIEREQGTRLEQAVDVLETILDLEAGELRWMPREFGSRCGDSWELRHAQAAADALSAAVARRSEDMVPGHPRFQLMVRKRASLRPLFLTAQTVARTSRLELVTTQIPKHSAFALTDPVSMIMAYSMLVDAPEVYGVGHHLHPLDGQGSSYAYKLLFDPALPARWMSWESHGRGERPWGSPQRSVLARSTSRALHTGALRLVREAGLGRGRKRFIAWASAFERSREPAYVAHPPARAGVVRRWPVSPS